MPQVYKGVNRSVEFADFRDNWKNARGGDPNWYNSMMVKFDEIKDDDARLSLFNQKLLKEIKNKATKNENQKKIFAVFFGKKNNKPIAKEVHKVKKKG